MEDAATVPQAESNLSILEKLTGFWEDKVVVVGPKILLILVIFLIVHVISKIVLKRMQTHLSHVVAKRREQPGEVEKRMTTLFAIINKVTLIVVWLIAVLVILGQLDVDIGPIIAAAGVFGLAISFGAQSLVKDIISGMFILFENQIRVGDVAQINGTGGLVEEINLRTVVLRDQQGTVHIFPNGTISTLANMTKDWSAAVFEIGVAYKEDVDMVMEVMMKVAAEMRSDETFGPNIIDNMEMMGVDKFADSAVIIRARIKTKPITQWSTGREYRRRLKRAFDLAGIEIPFPHQTLYMGDASQPFKLSMERTEPTTGAQAPRDKHNEEHHAD